MSRFSPLAPARVRVQVLPVGIIERVRFKEVLRALSDYVATLKLGDIETSDDQQTMLSPKSYPQGCLLFSYTTSPASEQEQQLSPFELFREPQLVLGIADGLSGEEDERKKDLGRALELLREQYPRVIHRHLLVLPELEGGIAVDIDNTTRVAKSGDDESGLGLKDAMSEVSERFLSEFSVYAKATQASPFIQTPGQVPRGMQRTSSLLSDEERPGSGYATPTQDTGVSSSVNEESSRPPSRNLRTPPPATSFEQIQREAVTPSALARSDSNRSKQGNRPSSQERVTTHALSQAKARDRGKARVGVVLGHIHLLAGQWSEALRLLTEHTNTVRKLSDNIWHAKGLEGIVVSMLLLASGRLEFSIPSICYPIAERSSASHVAKLSVNLSSDFRPADAAHQATVRRLSTSLPDLLKQILSLYETGEGAVELPPLVVAEVKVRFCSLLTTLYHSNNDLSGQTLTAILDGNGEGLAKKPIGSGPSGGLSRTAIAAILAEAQPPDDSSLSPSDQISILIGIYDVYAALGMSRKKGAVLKGILEKLTIAMTSARKQGAAEAGVHPAASMLADTTSDVIPALTSQSRSLDDIIDNLALVYGIELPASDNDTGATVGGSIAGSDTVDFGNDSIKLELLRAMAAFCEASSDPQGMLRTAAALLVRATIRSGIDSPSDKVGTIMLREEQGRLATTIARAVGAAKQMGLPDVQGRFWDPFLVRGLEFASQDAAHTLILHEPRGHQVTPSMQSTASNPLLYDPNASRNATAIQDRQVLIRSELQQCVVTLQNPLEVPLEVEFIQLVIDGEDGMEPETKDFQSTTLNASQMQRVSIAVTPSKAGDFDITGCRIRMAGCREEFFPIYNEPWTKKTDALVKHQGQDALRNSVATAEPQRTIVPATATMTMPLLTLKHTSAEDDRLMLLRGEVRTISIILRNTSRLPARVCGAHDSKGILRVKRETPASDSKDSAESGQINVVGPGETISLFCEAVGSRGMANERVNLEIFYCSEPFSTNDKYARAVTVPFTVRVDPALQLRRPDVVDNDILSFIFSFEVVNISTKQLAYRCREGYKSEGGEETVLSPGEARRVSLRLFRSNFSLDGGDREGQLRSALFSKFECLWSDRSFTAARWGRAFVWDLHPGLTRQHLETIRGPLFPITVYHSEDEVKVGLPVRFTVYGDNRTDTTSPHLIAKLQEVRSPRDERRVAFMGQKSQIVAPIEPGVSWSVEFTVFPTAAGEAVFLVTVRPAEDMGVDAKHYCVDATLTMDVLA